jgi:hypothetical protein
MNKISLAATILLLSAIPLAHGGVTTPAFSQGGRDASTSGQAHTAYQGWSHAPLLPANLPQQAQTADLIVVGRIKQEWSPLYQQIIQGKNDPSNPVVQRPLGELKQALFECITVDRVVKGTLPNASNQLSVHDFNWESILKVDKQHGIEIVPRPANIPFTRGCPQLTYGMVFLKADKEGRFSFINEDHIVFPASPAKPPGNTPRDPVAAVIGELLNVLQTPVKVLDHRGGALSPEYGGDGTVLASAGDVLCQTTVSVISELPKKLTLSRLADMAANSPDLRSRLWAIDCLINLGDMSLLSRAKPALLNPTPELGDVCRQIVHSVGTQLNHQNKESLQSANLASVFTDLLHSTSEETRLTALRGLRLVGTPDIAKPLAEVALNDDEASVRREALRLLCELTGTSESMWHTDPTKALAFAVHAERGQPFPPAMSPGAQFHQREINAMLNKRLPAERGEWYKVPQWSGRAKLILPGGNIMDAPDKVAIPTSDGVWMHTATWPHHDPNSEGWTSQGSDNAVLYGYRRCLEPVVHGDTLIQKCTAFFFSVDVKGGYEAVSAATGAAAQQLSSQKPVDIDDDLRNQFWALPSAKITDAWQEIDEETVDKLPNGKLKVTSMKRIFGFDGKPRTEAPSGFHAEATSLVEKAEAINTNLPDRGIDWRASLKSFLKTNPDELHKLR